MPSKEIVFHPPKNLNYNPPGILNRSIDIKSKLKITKIIVITLQSVELIIGHPVINILTRLAN